MTSEFFYKVTPRAIQVAISLIATSLIVVAVIAYQFGFGAGLQSAESKRIQDAPKVVVDAKPAHSMTRAEFRKTLMGLSSELRAISGPMMSKTFGEPDKKWVSQSVGSADRNYGLEHFMWACKDGRMEITSSASNYKGDEPWQDLKSRGTQIGLAIESVEDHL